MLAPPGVGRGSGPSTKAVGVRVEESMSGPGPLSLRTQPPPAGGSDGAVGPAVLAPPLPWQGQWHLFCLPPRQSKHCWPQPSIPAGSGDRADGWGGASRQNGSGPALAQPQSGGWRGRVGLAPKVGGLALRKPLSLATPPPIILIHRLIHRSILMGNWLVFYIHFL